MLAQIAPTVTVSPNVPAKTEYWQGYDQYIECAISGDYLSPEEYAAMTDAERRGYEAAARHQADTETDCYLSSISFNAYGDRVY